MDLISKREIHAGISLITEHGKGRVLELTHEVQEALRAKHPEAQPTSTEALIQGETPVINSIFFENFTGEVVRKTALTTKFAAGPSMGDAYVWRRMLFSFKSASGDLCNAVAEVARHLATNHVDPKGLMPILSNRLIPLKKKQGFVWWALQRS